MENVKLPPSLVDLVQELVQLAHQEHYNCEEDNWYACPLSRDGCGNDAIPKECNCGANAHNERVNRIAAQLGISLNSHDN